MVDPVELLRKLGKGRDPSSLGVGLTPAGYLDLRNFRLPSPRIEATIHTPAGSVDFTPTKPNFRRCRLVHVDLSGARLKDSFWERVVLKDVILDGANVQETSFADGTIESVSIRGADFRGSGWGVYGRAGPDVLNVDFVDSDLRESAFAHPRFRNCRFVRTRLDDVDFGGARFENCAFEGTLSDVWFRQRFRDPNPFVARLRNKMLNVDFSRAELVFPSFLGVDLSSCKLPTEGHMQVWHPRATFTRALEFVDLEWQGPQKEKAQDYLKKWLKYQFPAEIPLYVFRPIDWLESPLGHEVAGGILRELERASKELAAAH